jgi:hypothetical protein
MKNKLILSCMVAIVGAFSVNAAPKFQNIHLIPGNEAIGGKVTVIKNSQRWTADTVYICDRLTFVEAPAVLTIEPGTIVRMEQKTTGGTSVTDPADVGTLIICRGAKIVANGTAESPIIFTNIDDPFVPGGEITIPNKDNGVTSNASYAPYDTVTSANNSYTKRDYTGNKRFEYDSTCGGVIILGKTPVAFGNPGASGNIAIAVGNVGSGYESAPAVTFSPTGAAASAVLDGVGRVNRVSFTQRGLFNIESNGSVSFTASTASTPTTAATGTYTMRPVTGRVTSFTVSNGGSGYGTTAPAVTVSGTDPATATATLTSGVVTGITVVYHGSGYTSAPTVTIAAPSSGVQATATAVVTDYTGKFEIASVTMTEQGANYTAVAANGVVFAGLPSGADRITAPVASAPIGRAVVQYNITNPGGSYGSAPAVTVAAPPSNAGSSRVTATATASIAGAFTNPSASPLTSGVGANFIEGFQTIDGALLGSSVNYSGSIYGGSDDNDNSGTLRFVSIRYGGFILSPNNEINGLTTGAVGRGTLFEFIEVVNNADDDIEHFGGTVDMKYVAGLFGGDDGIDIDQGYRGRIQFGFQIQNNTGFGRPTANIGDCLGEWDGGESPTTSRPYTVHTLFNFTGIGTGSGASAGKGINYKENSGGKVFNSIFADARTGIVLEGGSSTATSATDGTTAGHRFAFTRTDGGVYNILGATGGAGEPDASLQYTTFMKIGTQTALNSSVLSGINATAGQYGAALIADKNNSYASTTGDIRSIARVSTTGQLDPRLTEASTIRNNGILPSDSGGVRATDTFYTQTQLRGAFRDCNWLSGWSLASEWGLFSDANVAIPAVRLTRASGVLTVKFTPTDGVEYVIETSPDGKKFTPFKTVTGGASEVSEALGAGTANSVLFVRCMPL